MGCLRSKSANEIAYATTESRSKVSSLKLLEFFEPWGPFVDGDLIEDEPLALLKARQFGPKPVIFGSTSEETVLYIYSAWNTSVDSLRYDEVVLATYPGHIREILSMYPPSYTSDERDVMSTMSTDLVFACPTRNATRLILGTGHRNVWVYVWDHAFSFAGWGSLAFCDGRVCHGSEIVYIFHSEWQGNYTFTPEEEVLSEQIMDFWANFAKTGDPNGSDKPGSPDRAGSSAQEWPAYSLEQAWPVFRFKTPGSNVEPNYRGPYCDFWDIVGYSA